MTPEEKRLDKYYQKKFDWSLQEVDALFANQDNLCAICHRPAGKYRLSLDHDHAFDRVKIAVCKRKDEQYWVAEAMPFIPPYGGYSTRKEAKDFIRRKLRRMSVRGGLCLRCNKGIQMFEDSKAPLSPAERFHNAEKYFRSFHEKSQQNSTVSGPSSISGA